MNEAYVATAGILIFFAMLIGACLYSETLSAERYSACVTAAHTPAECSLASK